MHIKWIKHKVGDYPGGPEIKNLPANVGDTGSFHGLGIFTCGGQLSLCATNIESVL